MDLFINTAIILNFIVSNSYCGMLRGHRHTNLSSEHPTMSQVNRKKHGRHIRKKNLFGYGLNHNISRIF